MVPAGDQRPSRLAAGHHRRRCLHRSVRPVRKRRLQQPGSHRQCRSRGSGRRHAGDHAARHPRDTGGRRDRRCQQRRGRGWRCLRRNDLK